jgi:hypothetical protein
MALLIEDEKMHIMSTRTVSQDEMLTLSGAHLYGFSLVVLIII